jgi:uncharacterized membrane protein
MSPRSVLRIGAVAIGSVAYVLGTHWLMTTARPSAWNVVGVVAPMLVAIAFGAWQGGQRALLAVALVVLAALGGQALGGAPVAPAVLYLAQHVGIHLFLAIGFGSTLLPGRTSLITTMASRIHRVFTPAMAVYTRKVTSAWTVYFVAMATLSIALHAAARFETWAVFANLLTPLAMVAMFIGEYLLRYWLHPEFERTSIVDAVRSYMAGAAPEQATGDTVA